MINLVEDYSQLEHWLSRTPIVGSVHPLFPLGLSQSVRVFKDGSSFLADLDRSNPSVNEPILILNNDSRLLARFPTVHITSHPSVDSINKNMHFHLDYPVCHNR